MAVEEMRSPIPEVSVAAKRELPDFVIEEGRAVRRLADPEIKRPVRPMYAFIRTHTPDLQPPDTPAEMQEWDALRLMAIAESNYPRWVGSLAVDSESHTPVWYSVSPQERDQSHYCTLRCSCSLPPFDVPDSPEYSGCPATDEVIVERAEVYRNLLALDGYVDGFKDGLTDVIGYLVDELRADHLAWPPSHRSDVLLVDGLAMTFNVSSKSVIEAAHKLQKRKDVRIADTEQPLLSLGA